MCACIYYFVDHWPFHKGLKSHCAKPPKNKLHHYFGNLPGMPSNNVIIDPSYSPSLCQAISFDIPRYPWACKYNIYIYISYIFPTIFP